MVHVAKGRNYDIFEGTIPAFASIRMAGLHVKSPAGGFFNAKQEYELLGCDVLVASGSRPLCR
jgi:hypothetical protein